MADPADEPAGELDRETALYGTATVFFNDKPDDPDKMEVWGEATDIATSILSIFENDEVSGVVIAVERGIPEDIELTPRKSDPRGSV